MERVRIVSGTHEYEGILLPSMKEGILLLKLDNGYNIGIREKGSKVTVLKKVIESKAKQSKVQQDKILSKITILHTGGTIASRVDYETGAVIARFTPEEIITMFPELQKIANVDSKLLRNMWSGDMRFAHYNIMAKAVAAEKKVKGIIITHGTDTMGYSAAALAFMLEGLDMPVILVGAQRSSDRGSSDAAVNLVCAAQFITKTDFKGVAICMHEGLDDETCAILPPCKTKKLHSSRRDAFKAVNVQPIARVTKEGAVTWISRPKERAAEFKLTLMNEKLKVGIVKFHPNFFAAELEQYKTFDGLIIEGTGLGNGPVDVIDKETKEHDKILKTINLLTKKMPVAMTTQCVFGKIDMDVYAYGRKLQQAGVIGNGTDMLTETAFVKLAWLLSNYPKKVKEMYVENLRGELT
ncbi:MAG TPA: Glu-tRNA(Gln) amidotransferase subunit GatD [Candidatus Nanoarchaeia archaeon]|nr:Glu-tRNA(Gln) amidotransferase subunit GatD [Candidatus Nanoarchaeia archaeon]